MTSLAESINKLYAAFADQPQPRNIEGCPCCIDRKGISTLLSKQLRDLTPHELTRYAASAFLTVGDVSDFLYFLPRIIEIAATDHAWYPEPEIVGRAIAMTSPQNWPPRRRQAMDELLHAIVHNAIDEREYFKLDSWLCAIARMGWLVEPLLKIVGESREAMLEYFSHNEKELRRGRLANPFWELPNQGHDAIVEWFRTEVIQSIFVEEYGYVPSPWEELK